MEPELESEQPAPSPPERSNGKGWRGANWILVGAILVLIGILVLARKEKEDAAPATQSENSPAAATPVAPVAKVERADLVRAVAIPAEFRPYVSVQLHGKVSGYLDRMNVDFGDRVTNGQLLLTIDVPELEDQLNSAIAAEQKAEVDYTNAHLIQTRIQGVDKEHPNLVAQQDIDTASANDAAAQAAVAAAKAEVVRYQTLAGYTNITAPFDAIVTHRYVDPGVLVEAGTDTASAQPLLEVSDNFRLRLDFPVAQQDVPFVHEGETISGNVQSLDGRPFSGKITRAAWEVNADTRTMTTEIEVNNPDLKLVPGMYASVLLPTERHAQVLSIPSEAVPPGETSTVFIVGSDGKIEERAVTLGIEASGRHEVLSGLQEGETVLLGNRTAYKPGQKVEPRLSSTDGR